MKEYLRQFFESRLWLKPQREFRMNEWCFIGVIIVTECLALGVSSITYLISPSTYRPGWISTIVILMLAIAIMIPVAIKIKTKKVK